MGELLSNIWFWAVIAVLFGYRMFLRKEDSGFDLVLNYVFRAAYTLVLLFIAFGFSIATGLFIGHEQNAFLVILMSGPMFVSFSAVFHGHKPISLTEGLFNYCASAYQAALGLVLGIGMYEWYKNPDLEAAEPTIAALSATIAFLQWAKAVWKELKE